MTIYLQDQDGRIIREFAPLHDATMGDHKELFALLTQYLKALELSHVSRIVFCGDGSDWIWSGVKALLPELGLASSQIYQVLDYTRAKQNLQQIIDLVASEKRNQLKIDTKWKEMLWQGNIMGIYAAICQTLTGKKKAPGSFWKRDMAEYFLFLRSQLLSGAFWPLGYLHQQCQFSFKKISLSGFGSRDC